ncbi:Permease of the drug/metabolite transporter (DMT) superfamily [Dethiosulfatibacter aminovorans DSM 17477]|uniref:Permease of the drug/metabolite transporter (DMT) superfamily n=1 Tax=Dethiosulfatibacter aminovorans DSM 17477 TaxID=1121476 RepID=A0A1M6K8G5_9FIRM|nr:DMT family transporter [Dethiosulfatibacter aminovorans]SHJ55214.1 Permease of the drug/metabolite transporter (DMT) superfamily [Dethiosulfatibacter aminovorans DSM 17477]
MGNNRLGKIRDLRTNGILLLTVSIWGLNPTIVKLGLRGMDNILFNISRTFVALIVCWMLLLKAEKDWKIRREDVPGILMTGFLGHFIYQAYYINGISLTTAGNTSLIYGLLPVFVVVINILFKLEKISLKLISGIVISFAGMVTVILGSGKDMSSGMEFFKGNLFIILATFSWAIYSITIKRYLKKYSPLKISVYGLSIGFICMLFFWRRHIDIAVIMEIPAVSIYAILYSGSLALGIATILWNKAIIEVGSTRTSVFTYFTPVISVVCGIIVLDEKFGLIQGLGCIMICCGLLLTSIKNGKLILNISNRKKA